jgi:hypothetical protein
MSEPAQRRGWAFPPNSRKGHYFIDSRSLCDRWLYKGPLENVSDADRRWQCVTCKRAYGKQVQR